VRLAEQLRLAIEEHPFVATPSGGIVRLAVNTGVAASEGGKDDRAAMLSQGREYLAAQWWIATFPGIAIAITVLGINLLGDGLREIFDPRL